MSKYGKLGMDVGFVGRWSRLIWGILILVPFAFEAIGDLTGSNQPLAFYGIVGVYLVGIAVAYTLVYGLLGERLFARSNPWLNTLILVGPALLIGWWDFTVTPFTGLELPDAFTLAMGIYIGISFIIQWRIRYGGCEVVSLPIILFKKRYTAYCIPLVAVDAVEKQIVDALAKSDRGELTASESREA